MRDNCLYFGNNMNQASMCCSHVITKVFCESCCIGISTFKIV